METTHTHHHDHDHDHHHDHDYEAVDRKEWAKAAILLGLSSYFAYNLVSGKVTNYINARFIWLSHMEGGLFLLYAHYMTYTLIQASRGHAIEHDHAHEHANWGVIAIVAIPVLIGFFSTSTPLGADAVNGGVSLSAIGGENGMVISSDDPLQWHVLDWLRAMDQTEDLNELAGTEAGLIGFVYREPGFPADMAMLTRFTVNCCVADASAIGLPMQGTDIANLEQGTWVLVNGPMAVDTFEGEETLILNPQTIEFVEVPDPPYIYP